MASHEHLWIAVHAPRTEVGGDRPFVIAGDSVWQVQHGRVDVYAVTLAAGEPAGRRRHLFRVQAGDLLVGTGSATEPDGIGLLGVGGSGTQLVELDRGRIQELAAQPPYAPAICRLLDRWVATLCRSMLRGPRSADCVLLEAGTEVEPPARSLARPADGIGWVQHVAGRSRLLGRSGLTVNGAGHTPISDQVWLEVGEGSRLRVESTRELLERHQVWTGLDRLHVLLLQCAAQDWAFQSERDRERLRRRLGAVGLSLRTAFETLAETLNPTGRVSGSRRENVADREADGDPLYAACRRVAAALDIRVRPLPASASAIPARDPLAALARANRFRTRRVLLRDQWWKEDCGAMLGYRGEEQRPVALIPLARGGYLAADPQEAHEEPVTEAVAESISPRADVFYRPFPDHELGIADLVGFALRGRRRDILMVAAMGIAGGLLSLVVPLATGVIFNDVIPGAARPQLVQLTFVLLVAAVAAGLFTLASGMALVRLETRMGSSVQAAVWDRLLGLQMQFFRPYPAGNLATRAMGIDAIRQLLSGVTITALLAGLFSVFHFGLLFYYSPRLAAWAALLIGAAIAVTLAVGRAQMRWERQITAIQTRLAGLVLQFLTSIAKLRVAAAESHAFAIWAHQFGHQRQLQFRARSVRNLLATFQAALPIAAALALYALALPLLHDPATGLRTGDFLAFMSSFMICMTGMITASSALIASLTAIPLYELAKPILEARPEVDTARSDPGPLTGDVEVDQLSFRYDADGPLILRDLSVRIRSGEYVAFVGPSGSGKSTLLRLLLGFETAGSGAIYYDGQELGGLDVQAVRRQIGVVLQNGRLMSGDLFTNIVGSSNATLNEAWEAAELAGLAEDIRGMPMGMHTIVSEGAGTLSGGQRQRLMIARAIVSKPRLLFFDEATSALDNRTQAIVSASLEKLQVTRVVIAHRLSTIMKADRTYVVQAGRLAQQGTYSELIEQPGLFAELAKRQLV